MLYRWTKKLKCWFIHVKYNDPSAPFRPVQLCPTGYQAQLFAGLFHDHHWILAQGSISTTLELWNKRVLQVLSRTDYFVEQFIGVTWILVSSFSSHTQPKWYYIPRVWRFDWILLGRDYWVFTPWTAHFIQCARPSLGVLNRFRRAPQPARDLYQHIKSNFTEQKTCVCWSVELPILFCKASAQCDLVPSVW